MSVPSNILLTKMKLLRIFPTMSLTHWWLENEPWPQSWANTNIAHIIVPCLFKSTLSVPQTKYGNKDMERDFRRPIFFKGTDFVPEEASRLSTLGLRRPKELALYRWPRWRQKVTQRWQCLSTYSVVIWVRFFLTWRFPFSLIIPEECQRLFQRPDPQRVHFAPAIC